MTEDVDELHFLLQHWIVYSDHSFLCRYLYWMLMPYTHNHSSHHIRPSCSMSSSTIRNMQLLWIELQHIVK
jgi:hypothetical protein